MKEAKRPACLRFDEFKNEGKKTLLGEITTWKSGGTPKKDFLNYWKGSLPWISASEMRGKYYDSSQYNISAEALAKGSSLAPKGSLLLLVRGSMLFKKVPVGITTINVAFNQDIKCLIVKDNVEVEYLYQWFSAKEHQIMNLVVGTGIGAGKLDTNDMKTISITLPSLPEQRKIATFLSAVDKKISKLEQKKALLEQYKKGMMQQLFSRKLRFKRADGSGYPDWKESTLAKVLHEHKTKNSNDSVDEVFSVAKKKGVINQLKHLGRSYSAKSIAHYKVVNPGDVIYTKSPTKDFPYGIIKQNLTGRIGVTSPLYVVLKPINENIGFMLHCYFLSWVNTYNYLNPLVQKGAKNTMNINNNDFLNGAKIALPVSEEEQSKIASFLYALDHKIELVNKQLLTTQLFKKGLLQQMFV